MASQMKTLNIFNFFITDDTVCWSVTHIQMCVPFHSPLRADFPSRCHQPLQCPLVSPFGVPYRVEDSLLQNWCRSWTSQSTGTLAVVTDMHHRTGLPFVDEFRWVSPLHYLKNGWQNRCSALVHVASGTVFFTLILRRRVAFLHRTATCQPLFKPWASLISTYMTIKLCFEFLWQFWSFHLTVPRMYECSSCLRDAWL